MNLGQIRGKKTLGEFYFAGLLAAVKLCLDENEYEVVQLVIIKGFPSKNICVDVRNI